MAFARKRAAALSAAAQQTVFCSAKRGAQLTVSGTFVGTISLIRRASDGNTYPVTNQAGTAITWTAPFSWNMSPIFVQGDYALQMSAYTSGTANALVEGW